MKSCKPLLLFLALTTSQLYASGLGQKPSLPAEPPAPPKLQFDHLKPYQNNDSQAFHTSVAMLAGWVTPNNRVVASSTTNSQLEANTYMSFGAAFRLAATEAGANASGFALEYQVFLPNPNMVSESVNDSASKDPAASEMQSARPLAVTAGQTSPVELASARYDQQVMGEGKLLFHKGSFVAEEISLTPQMGIVLQHFDHSFLSTFQVEESRLGAGTVEQVSHECAWKLGPVLQGLLRKRISDRVFLEGSLGTAALVGQHEVTQNEGLRATETEEPSFTETQNAKNTFYRIGQATYLSVGAFYVVSHDAMNVTLELHYKAMAQPDGIFVTSNSYGAGSLHSQGINTQHLEFRLGATF